MTSTKLTYLIYEDFPRYDPILKWVVVAILSLTLLPAIVLLYIDIVGAWALFFGTVLDALLFYIIIPRRYQVFSDRIRIVLGKPFSINLKFSVIKDSRIVSSSKAFIYWGLKMATSSKGMIEIVRQSGIDVVISPRDSETFLRQLKEAMNTYRTD